MTKDAERQLRISATEAARNFGGLVDRVRERQASYIVERAGVPVARIVPMRDRGATVRDLVRLLREPYRSDAFARAVGEGVSAFNRADPPKDAWDS